MRLSTRLIMACMALTLITGMALAAGFQESHTFNSDELILVNLIGEINVEPARGDSYEVLVSVQGEDADPDLVTVNLDDGRRARLEVRFPVDEHRDYVYPELGRGKTQISQMNSEGADGFWDQLWRGLKNDRVTVRGKGKGLEVWADITIKVPEGRETKVYLGAGHLTSGDVDGELVLDTHSGPVRVDGHTGSLLVDTGSGAVKVYDVDGPVLVDTGSGSVKVENQVGDSVKVDTGSGSVTVSNANTSYLLVDTGSGSVTASGIQADKAKIDTGSGSVALLLDRMGDGRFVIDTGSGSVKLALPDDASATITVDTGSGGVRNKIKGAEILRKDDGELKMRVGDGDARVDIDTGSGGVTIASSK